MCIDDRSAALLLSVLIPAITLGSASCATTGAAAAMRSMEGPPAVHPDVEPLAWLVGRWSASGGTDGKVVEDWTPAGDALIGVSFTAREGRTAEWEVMIIRRDPAGLALQAMPNGQVPVTFRLEADAPTAIEKDRAATFAAPAHDFPKTIRYARADGGNDAKVASGSDRSDANNAKTDIADKSTPRLVARIAGDDRAVDFAYESRPPAPAAALEEADRRFAEDTARRGADAWVEAFDPAGAMGRPDRRIEGHDAIRAAMTPVFQGGQLLWTPIASGLSPAGDLGFTVGRYRALALASAGGAEQGRGAYVSIWRRGDDGRWRVLFDVGDPEARKR